MSVANTKFHHVTHVLFDMDGLLLESEPRYQGALSKLCRRYGQEYTVEATLNSMGSTQRAAAESIIRDCKLPISIEEFLKEIDVLYTEAFQEKVDLMPGAERLVKHLKANNVPICIATSSLGPISELKLKHHVEFTSLFDHIVKGSDPELKNGKPAPDIFLIAASRFSTSPTDMKNALVFEDSINGIKAGNAAGMQTVWVPSCSFIDTTAAEATMVISSLEEFDPTLFGLPGYKN